MTVQRILSGILALSLLLQSNLLVAESSSLPAIAVLELHHPQGSSPQTARLADRVRERLRQEGGYRLLSRREVDSTLASLRQETGTERSLGQLVERAKDQYVRLELEAAEATLRRKLNKIQAGEITYQDSASLVPAYLLLGVIEQGIGDSNQALEALAEAARLAPDTVLSERDYSPTLRSIFQRAHDDLMKGKERFGNLKISSSPSHAKVYLNGRYKGETPLQLSDIPPERHYLALTHEGFANQIQTVEVIPLETEKLKITLEESTTAEGSAALSVSDAHSNAEILREAALAGQWLNVDRLVLVDVVEQQGQLQATARMIDLTHPHDSTQKTVQLSESELAPAVNALVAFLSPAGESRVVKSKELNRAPKPLAFRGESKPFWKRPVVWIVGGLLVAGGTGAGIAFSTGGGGNNTSIAIETPVPGVTLQ